MESDPEACARRLLGPLVQRTQQPGTHSVPVEPLRPAAKYLVVLGTMERLPLKVRNAGFLGHLLRPGERLFREYMHFVFEVPALIREQALEQALALLAMESSRVYESVLLRLKRLRLVLGHLESLVQMLELLAGRGRRMQRVQRLLQPHAQLIHTLLQVITLILELGLHHGEIARLKSRLLELDFKRPGLSLERSERRGTLGLQGFTRPVLPGLEQRGRLQLVAHRA